MTQTDKSWKWKKRLRSGCFAIMIGLIGVTLGAQPSGIRIVASANTTASISQDGITWHFAGDVEYGQFANDDYWVVGPVTIVNIDPSSTVDNNGWTVNGSMVNPENGQTQGYDSEPSASGYSAANNAGRPGGGRLTADNPLHLDPGSSLISSRSVSTPGNWPQLSDAAVLTVLSEPPPEGSFRPPYAGHDKSLNWNVADIDWSYLQNRQVSRNPVSSYLRSIENDLHPKIRRVWLDHDTTWTFSRLHPANNMPDYGRDMASLLGDVALSLMLDYPREQLEPLLISFLQIGIDTFGVAETGGTWPHDGGVFLGRKLPILFTGLILGDSRILDYADASKHYIFQEDQQTYYVDQKLVDCSQEGVNGCWNPDTRNRHYAPYTDGSNGTVDMRGWPEWGIRYRSWRMSDPSWAWSPDSDWRAMYRNINSGALPGSALVAHMLDATDDWNWPAFFDYIDRWVYADDNPYPDEPRWDGIIHRPLTYHMWHTYRENYGPIWSD